MDLRLELLSWSFGAGLVAFFNPCGMAMLPAYVAHYLGRRDDHAPSRVRALGRGLSLGAVVSGGFITVFAALGLLVSLIGGVLGSVLPWLGTVIGLGLIGLGLSMLLGHGGMSAPIFERWAERISRATQGTGNPQQRERDLPFYYVYGITYALASVGCTFPIFLIVVTNAFSSGGTLNGLLQFGAYALGMTLMMLGLSVAMVVSKDLLERVLPRVMGVVRWVGGLGVTAAGGYLIWYNLIYTGIVSL